MMEHFPNHLEDELCFAIYSAQKYYNKFYTESLKEFCLTYPQYITLLVLWEEKKPLMIKEIGARVGLDTGTLTPLLKRMEKDEWVMRKHDIHDGRKVYVTLTQKAKDLEMPVKEKVRGCFSLIDMDLKEYNKRVDLVKEIGDKIKDLDKQFD